MYFREKVVQLRKDASMTQDYFARAVGVSRQAVYKWEKGKSYPEAEKLILIAKLFNVTVDSLLEDDYALFNLSMPAVQVQAKKAPAKKKVAKAAAPKKTKKAPARVERQADDEALAAVFAPPAVTKTEKKETEAKKATPVREPAPLRSTVHKAQPQKQKKQQGFFDGIRGLFGRKK